MTFIDAVESFHLLENSHKLCRGFHQAMKALRTCFISFILLLDSELTKKKYAMRSAHVSLYFFNETVNYLKPDVFFVLH